MKVTSQVKELIERAEIYFHDFENFKKHIICYQDLYTDLHNFKKNIITDLEKNKKSDRSQILETVFSKVL